MCKTGASFGLIYICDLPLSGSEHFQGPSGPSEKSTNAWPWHWSIPNLAPAHLPVAVSTTAPPASLPAALATLERSHFLQHAFPLWAFAMLFPRQPLPSCPAPSSPPNSPPITVEFRCHLLHEALHDAPGRMSYSACPQVFLWVFESILPLLPICFPGRIPISHKNVGMYFINPSWALSSSLSSHPR